jgi:hypothetical protein
MYTYHDVHICVFMYMYIQCTYMFTTVCKLVNMYIHVCTMFRHVCTNLPIPAQVVRVRIPDDHLPPARSGASDLKPGPGPPQS